MVHGRHSGNHEAVARRARSLAAADGGKLPAKRFTVTRENGWGGLAIDDADPWCGHPGRTAISLWSCLPSLGAHRLLTGRFSRCLRGNRDGDPDGAAAPAPPDASPHPDGRRLDV